MPKFLEVNKGDKDDIIEFLNKNISIKKDEFDNIFRLQKLTLTREKESFYGWCIKDENKKIRGFLGAITHKSPYHKNKLVVNMTSWVVCSDYRAHSLGLLKSFINNKSMIYTNFSASINVQRILPRFGFKVIDDGTNIYKTYLNIGLKLDRGLEYGDDAISNFIGTEHENIINDHVKIGGLIISSPSGRAYIFFKKKINLFNSLHLIHVINFSSRGFYDDWVGICNYALVKHFSTKIFVDNRFAPQTIKPNHFVKRKMFVKGLKKNEKVPTRAYSEPLPQLAI